MSSININSNFYYPACKSEGDCFLRTKLDGREHEEGCQLLPQLDIDYSFDESRYDFVRLVPWGYAPKVIPRVAQLAVASDPGLAYAYRFSLLDYIIVQAACHIAVKPKNSCTCWLKSFVHWEETFMSSGAIYFDDHEGYLSKPLPLDVAVRVLDMMVSYAENFNVAFAVTKSEIFHYADQMERVYPTVVHWSGLHRVFAVKPCYEQPSCRCDYGVSKPRGAYGDNLVYVSPTPKTRNVVWIRKGPLNSNSTAIPMLGLSNHSYRKATLGDYDLVDLFAAVLLEMGVARVSWFVSNDYLGSRINLGSILEDAFVATDAGLRFAYDRMTIDDRAVQDGLSDTEFYLKLKAAGKRWAEMFKFRWELLLPMGTTYKVLAFSHYQPQYYLDLVKSRCQLEIAEVSHRADDLVIDLCSASGPRDVDHVVVSVPLEVVVQRIHAGSWNGRNLTTITSEEYINEVGAYVDITLSSMFVKALGRIKQLGNVVLEVPTFQAVPTLLNLVRDHIRHFRAVRFKRMGGSDPLVLQYHVYLDCYLMDEIGGEDQGEYFSAMAGVYDRGYTLPIHATSSPTRVQYR